MDLDNHQYWVTFDRPGLGKHSIPDTEIKVHCTCIDQFLYVYIRTYCVILVVRVFCSFHLAILRMCVQCLLMYSYLSEEVQHERNVK